MYAFGSTIDCLMNCSSGFPAFAASCLSLSRSGPIFPVAPAAANVWQAPQPADAKTCLPSGFAAPPPVVVAAVVVGAVLAACTPQAGTPAHLATYVAASWASLPRSRFCGMAREPGDG